MKYFFNFFISLTSFLLAQNILLAQPNQVPQPTPAAERSKAIDIRKKLTDNSLAATIPFQSIGPTVMSGRVTDVDINPRDPTVFYVSYASGGLWKTESNGANFSPLFDSANVMTIGDIAVNWENNVIWVGTGEQNSSRSSYAGNGIYKSEDEGKTWQHLGLDETHHIARVVLHPTNPNIVWVAALGHLYTPNRERGVFMTSDGGKTWRQTLFVNETTGAIDLTRDEDNPNILYAAMWEKTRTAWDFKGAGKSSGIYKSNDGGETWTLLTDAASGFPTGDGVGRIGLATTSKAGKSYLYAILDNQANKPKKDKPDNDDLTKDRLRTMSKTDFLALDKKLLTKYLKRYDFPEKYDADAVITLVKIDKIKPLTLVEYLEDANANLFDTEVKGGEVYLSEDGGKSWKKTHEGYLDDLFFTYGYYFAQIRVTQNRPEQLYILGTRIAKSKDGGKTWRGINRENVHWDHHALWVNPSRAGHLINGNDGGINISYNDGRTWQKCNSPAVGQCYAIAVDNADNYNVYCGMQDNGVWTAAHNAELDNEWQATGQNPFKNLIGGDGMQIAVDTRDNQTVYTGYQFGNYFRVNRSNPDDAKEITPRHELGERPLRWNWQSPILRSTHQQDVLYFGANKLYRSFNKGSTWEAISADLTKGGVRGNVPYGTLTAIHESPMKFGLLYAGSDDGNIHVTKDGGENWTNISNGLPQNLWVSRVQASAHERGRVYVSLNAYRFDDFTPYLYVSDNYGQTWQRIGTDLPTEAINVVKEDLTNQNLLYLGTDHGLYFSLDAGRSFQRFAGGLPMVSVHDLAIQPREHHLVVGTHGRSMYVANVQHLQQLDKELLAENLHLFELKKIKHNANWGKSGDKWAAEDPNDPKTTLPLYSRTAGNVGITLKQKDLVLRRWTQAISAGLNYVDYDLSFDEGMARLFEKMLNEAEKDSKTAKKIEFKKADNGKMYLPKGTYQLELEKDGKTLTREWKVE